MDRHKYRYVGKQLELFIIDSGLAALIQPLLNRTI